MKRCSYSVALGAVGRILLTALLVVHQPVMAAIIVVDGSACTLVDAITAANSDTATGGCSAGSGADVVQLTTDVTLTAVDNSTDGDNGLPSVTSQIDVIGVGASLPRAIVRDAGAAEFRIFHVDAGGSLGLDAVAISNGLAGSGFVPGGGGVFNRGEVTLTNSTVSDNSTTQYADGGGINNSGIMTLTNSSVSSNSASASDGGGYGGGIYNTGTMTLNNSSVSGNYTRYHTYGGYGGGIFNKEGTVTLTDSTVTGNSSFYGGGIVSHGGEVTLTNSTVSDNSASEAGGIYGGVVSTWTLNNSTVSGNSASGDRGGAIRVKNNSTATFINSTVSGNSASGYGGGISVSWASTVNLTNSTVSGNSANAGGAISNGTYGGNYGIVILTGSLVADSPTGGNCDGPVTDSGGNLADDATCATIPGTLTGLDTTLADNGGPTMTHALLASSNAIDLAGTCGFAFDQRGAPRFDGACDSGAFEHGGCPRLQLANDTVDGVESYEECEIWMGPSFSVFGDLTLTGGQGVVLFDGSEVLTGGVLTIGIDPNLQITSALEAAARAGFEVP